MTIRQFLNAYTGERNSITILEYIGSDPIGADPEEDYNEVGTYTPLGYIGDFIPDSIINRKVEYFNIENGKITIWMED